MKESSKYQMTFRPNLDIDAMDDTVKEVEAFVAQSGVVKNYQRVDRNGSESKVLAQISYKRELDTPTQEIVDDWNLELKDISPICEVKVISELHLGNGIHVSNRKPGI